MESTSKSPYKPVIHPHNKSSEIKNEHISKRRKSAVELPANFSSSRRKSATGIELGHDLHSRPRRSSFASIEIPPSFNGARRKSTTHIEIPHSVGGRRPSSTPNGYRRKSVANDEIQKSLQGRRKSVVDTSQNNSRTPSRRGSKKYSNPSSRRPSEFGYILRDEENLEELVNEMVEKLQQSQLSEEMENELKQTIQITISEYEEDDDLEKRTRNEQLMKRVCELLGAKELNDNPDKKDLKWLVMAELNRPKTQMEQLMADHCAIDGALIGRRIFDEVKIGDESTDDESSGTERYVPPVVESRYMKIFDKQSSEETEQKMHDEDLATIKEKPVEFGLWDQVLDPENVIANVERPSTPRAPSTFEEHVRLAQKEAHEREAQEAAEDPDLPVKKPLRLKDHEKTGKYLHEMDLAWCMERTKMGQPQIIKWFKRFRKASPKGQMTRNELKDVYKKCYRPQENVENGDIFADEIFKLFEIDTKSGFLDFKDFLIIIEVTTFTLVAEKLKWLASLLDQDNTGFIFFSKMKAAVQLMDAIDDPIPDDNYDDPVIYTEEKFKAFVTERSQDERLLMLRKYLTIYDNDRVSVQSFKAIPARIITAYEF